MLSLDNLLSKNRAPSSDEAYVRHAISCSPFARRLFTKDAGLLNDLLVNLHQEYLLSDMQYFLSQQKIVDEISLKLAVRLLRQQVLARIIVRDLNGLAGSSADGLHEVMRTTTHLAECVINTSIDYLNSWLVEHYGQPVDQNGIAQSFIVIGMGKLGGRELNVSSDIDLIFAYVRKVRLKVKHQLVIKSFLPV